MELIEWSECLILRWDQEWPSRKPLILNGVMYVVDEWRMSSDEKVHWHLMIPQSEWQRKYGN